jgi:hypothetical protein
MPAEACQCDPSRESGAVRGWTSALIGCNLYYGVGDRKIAVEEEIVKMLYRVRSAE